MPTPHNTAQVGEIAKTVLMPGDPLRAKFIAEHYLTDAKLVNEVRNMYCFTGTYEGKPVSVMGSGMGMPSIGIYSYELYSFYDVDQIIRIGSAGSIQKDVKIRDIVIGQAAATDGNYQHILNLPGTPALIADYGLIEKSVNYAREHNLRWHVGSIVSSGNFYCTEGESAKWAEAGVLAVEMEAAALYTNAAITHKKALAICTISDELFTDGSNNLSAEERQSSFDDMMKLALSLI